MAKLRTVRVLLAGIFLVAGGLGLAQQQAASRDLGIIVPISGEINAASAAALERRLEQAEQRGAAVVVLDIDTPGGEVGSAIRMADAILNAATPSLAVVTNAFSAGALIAMSGEQVAMLPGSEIGAALPISGTGQAIEGVVGEKINSALRAKFRSVAETRGRPADLAEAMVNPNKVVPGVKERGDILTLTATDAVKLGVANLQARSLEDAVRSAGYANLRLERLELTSAERVGAFLTNPIIAAVLLAIGVIGLLIEVLHPGVALPGLIGAAALIAYFGGSFLLGNASGVAFLLFVAGLLLLAAEVTVIPGFGLAGVAGFASILASIYLSFGDQFALVAGISVVMIGVGVALTFWLLPNSQFAQRFALNESLAGNLSEPGRERLVGRYGRAISDLRPAGVADLDGERVDVVTEGEFLDHDTLLEVTRVEGRRVVVRALKGMVGEG
jgi:membrane-bound serine protease (ClpP class)